MLPFDNVIVFIILVSRPPVAVDGLTLDELNTRSWLSSCPIYAPISFFSMLAAYSLKGAVSYRFSQGLLTLMCNNSKLKADINLFFFLLHRQTSKVYNWLQKFTIQHPVALL